MCVGIDFLKEMIRSHNELFPVENFCSLRHRNRGSTSRPAHSSWAGLVRDSEPSLQLNTNDVLGGRIPHGKYWSLCGLSGGIVYLVTTSLFRKALDIGMNGPHESDAHFYSTGGIGWAFRAGTNGSVRSLTA